MGSPSGTAPPCRDEAAAMNIFRTLPPLAVALVALAFVGWFTTLRPSDSIYAPTTAAHVVPATLAPR